MGERDRPEGRFWKLSVTETKTNKKEPGLEGGGGGRVGGGRGGVFPYTAHCSTWGSALTILTFGQQIMTNCSTQCQPFASFNFIPRRQCHQADYFFTLCECPAWWFCQQNHWLGKTVAFTNLKRGQTEGTSWVISIGRGKITHNCFSVNLLSGLFKIYLQTLCQHGCSCCHCDQVCDTTDTDCLQAQHVASVYMTPSSLSICPLKMDLYLVLTGKK